MAPEWVAITLLCHMEDNILIESLVDRRTELLEEAPGWNGLLQEVALSIGGKSLQLAVIQAFIYLAVDTLVLKYGVDGNLDQTMIACI